MTRLLCVLLTMWAATAFGQQSTLTPYSIYGLGDPASSAITSQSAMGHAGLAVLSSTSINPLNPATYGQMAKPAFNFDLRNEFLSISSASNSQSNSLFSIQNFSFAFPLINDPKKKRRSGFSFGITPYTRQGYDMFFSEEVQDLGEVEYRFLGSGGINNVYAGFSIDLLADRDSGEINALSLGLNANYLFGQLSKTRTTQFAASAAASNLYRSSDLEMSDADFTIGLLYKKLIVIDRLRTDDKKQSQLHISGKSIRQYERQNKGAKADDVPVLFSIGGFLRPSTGLNSFYSILEYTYSDTLPNQEPIDTLNTSSANGNTVSPTSYGVGLSLNFNKRWMFALDMVQTRWSQLEINQNNAGLLNASRLSFGVEYTPDYEAYQSFLKTVRYRSGLSVEQSRLNINSSQPMRYGINFGLGIPLVASNSYPTSMFNVAVEFAQRQAAGAALTENYVNLQIGFTITPNRYDGWFVKKKYD